MDGKGISPLPSIFLYAFFLELTVYDTHKHWMIVGTLRNVNFQNVVLQKSFTVLSF
jgi:hypothetical protein